jgi:CRISPR/Cas system type I-B associated protein Csh2 (Cas7 group RAMP superfamily)
MESKGVKNYLDYFTEQDLIDRYSARRKGMTREDAEDLYRALYKFILYKLEDNSAEKMGFNLKGFCTFLHKRLKLDNLKKSIDSPIYKRAEMQLHHYLSGHQRLKIDDK